MKSVIILCYYLRLAFYCNFIFFLVCKQLPRYIQKKDDYSVCSKTTAMAGHVARIIGVFVWANVFTVILTNPTDSSEIDLSDEMDGFTTTKRTLPDRCLVKTEPGPCKQYVHKWSFNKTEGKCRMFPYGGCLGNENRFNSEAECLHHCVGGPERKQFTLILNNRWSSNLSFIIECT